MHSVVHKTFHIYPELSLTIPDVALVVKEGENIDITCIPSSPTVALEWELPVSVSDNAATMVDYDEPLHHTISLRRANIRHMGDYTCRVVGDVDRTITAASASVRVRESKKSLEGITRVCIYLFCDTHHTIVLFIDTKEKIWTHFGLFKSVPGTIDKKSIYTRLSILQLMFLLFVSQ